MIPFIRLALVFLFTLSTVKAAPDCKADYDSFNIPHLKVNSQEEFYYCFGFHHGKDRAWQMDYFRRVAQGRNAEVLGFAHLKSDLMMRLLDIPQLAGKLWEESPADKKILLEQYAAGVNQGFLTGKTAREFQDHDYVPESWTPVDSLSVLLLQSFDQTRRTFFMDYDEERSRLKWGKSAEKLFDHDGVPWLNTILKEGEYPKSSQETIQEQTTSYFSAPELWGRFPEVFGEESGSNNWVISKQKSKSGHALLANDPHLDLMTPLFWYWVDIKSSDGQVIGASLPGVPTIAAGTNGKVAWGLTNAYINSADALFVKDIPPQEMESIRPTVWVKLWFLKLPFFFKSFERTKSGHRVLPLEIKSDHPMLLRWSGFSLKPDDIYSMLELPGVQNVAGMNELLKRIGLPAWNFVFADTAGEIGYRVIGKSYRHQQKLAFGIPVVSYQDLKQEDFLSPDERPHVLKPKRQYVYSANNRHWPADAAFYGGRGYSHSFRGFRIDELLIGQHDVDSFKAIQCDTQVVDARFFVPKLLKHLELAELKNWNYLASDESVELPLYRRLMDLLMEKWEVNEYALYRLLDALSPQKKKELHHYYLEALTDIKGRSWGELHLLGFKHLSRNNAWVFSPEIAGVGDNQTVNPGTAKWNDDRKIYEQSAGASMRMIIEMSKKPQIYLALPGLNRLYTDKPGHSPWQDWRECKYSEIKY